MEAILLYKRDLDLVSSNHVSRLGTLKDNEILPDSFQFDFTEKDYEIMDSAVEQFLMAKNLMQSMSIFETVTPPG